MFFLGKTPVQLGLVKMTEPSFVYIQFASHIIDHERSHAPANENADLCQWITSNRVRRFLCLSPATSIDQSEKSEVFCSLFTGVQAPSSFDRFIRLSKIFPRFQIHSIGSAKMVTYSIKDLMGLCSDYALDAQIQKILFSLDLWVPKAARVWSPCSFTDSVHPIDRVNFSRKFILIMWLNNDMLRVWFRDSIAPGS